MASSSNPSFNISIGKILAGIFAAFLIATAVTLFYQVPTDSEAVVLRLGKPLPVKKPGLHFKLPLGIDQVNIVPVQRQNKLEFGFATQDATNPYQYTDVAEQRLERDMVTGDLNAVEVSWVVQYRIDDAKRFLFNVRNPEFTLRDATESVMRQVVGDRTVDEVLTVGRAGIEQEADQNLRELINSFEMGIEITQVQLKEVNPPEALNAAFQAVNSAQQEKQTRINEANKEYDSAIPRERGKAQAQIEEAEGYAAERVNRAKGDANRFTALFSEYQKAPEVTRRRIYLETMAEVVPGLGRKIVLDEEANQMLPLLQLNPETSQP